MKCVYDWWRCLVTSGDEWCWYKYRRTRGLLSPWAKCTHPQYARYCRTRWTNYSSYRCSLPELGVTFLVTHSHYSRIHSRNSQIFILLSFFAYLLTLRLDFLSFYFAMNAFIQPGLRSQTLSWLAFILMVSASFIFHNTAVCLSTYYQ